MIVIFPISPCNLETTKAYGSHRENGANEANITIGAHTPYLWPYDNHDMIHNLMTW